MFVHSFLVPVWLSSFEHNGYENFYGYWVGSVSYFINYETLQIKMLSTSASPLADYFYTKQFCPSCHSFLQLVKALCKSVT